MRISRILTALLVATLSSAQGALTQETKNDDKDAAVIAELNGHKLTVADLEKEQQAKLLQARYQYYLVEREAVNQLIEDQLWKTEADRENLTVEELVKREVTDKVREPTEDQLQVFYEGLRTEEPFAVMREKIVTTLRQIREGKARAAYLQALRDHADVHIALAPPEAEVEVENAPRQGAHDAPVVIVEFADYECPYCQRVYPQLKKLEEEFAGRVALAFKDFPLPMHAQAEKAAEAARCAGEQGKFWEYHDTLFDNSQNLDFGQLKEYARALNLNSERFDQCLDAGEQTAAVRKDFTQGQRLGLNGTPAFFVNGHFLSGAVKYDTLREVIEQQLARLPAASAKQIASN